MNPRYALLNSASAFLILLALGAFAWGSVSPATAGPHPHGPSASPPDDICRCEIARSTNGWCGSCRVGYLAALPIPSADFYEFLDAHGHEMDLTHTPCPTCPEASRTDGYCATHRIGYVDGLGYVTRLSYLLAKAKRLNPVNSACPPGAAHAGDAGWCDACSRGVVGSFTFTDRGLFDEVMEDRSRLEAALEILNPCESCAMALYSSGRCSRCNIHYRDGKPLSARPSATLDED